MSEKVGIEVLKKDVVIVCNVVGTTDKALADTKINMLEGFQIAKDAIGLIQVARTWSEAKKEIQDLSATERLELQQHVEKELDLRNDQAETMVQTAIGVILSLGAALIATRTAA